MLTKSGQTKEASSEVAMGLLGGLPDLANNNTGCPAKFEFQMNNKYFISISMSQIFRIKYPSTLSGCPTLGPFFQPPHPIFPSFPEEEGGPSVHRCNKVKECEIKYQGEASWVVSLMLPSEKQPLPPTLERVKALPCKDPPGRLSL